MEPVYNKSVSMHPNFFTQYGFHS